MASWNDSLYENVPITDSETECSQEVIECVVNDVLKVIGVSNALFYCPFCIAIFSRVNLLKKHLATVHVSFIYELTTRSVGLQICPICPGRFAGYHLVAKHSLHSHETVLVDAFFPKTCGLTKCLFCETTCESRLMATHLEQHGLEFVEWFKSTFPLQPGGSAGLVELIEPVSDLQNEMLVDSLQYQLERLEVISSQKPKSILKSPRAKQSSTKLPVRRVLTFSDDKENQNLQSGTLSSSQKKKQTSVSLNWSPVVGTHPYQCGKCTVTFSSCNKLVLHVKSNHKRFLSVRQPLYQCFLCNAKFFKNSYLEKHCVTHSQVKARNSIR